MDISIKKPCHEDWNKMTPNEKGAFCLVCTKDVIDFTRKSLDEIKEYFSKPKEGRTCGQFKGEQLLELGFDGFFRKFSGFKISRKVAFVIAVTFMSWLFGSTDAVAQDNTLKMGKVAVDHKPVKDTSKVNTTTITGNVSNTIEHPKGEVSVGSDKTCTDPKSKPKSRNKSKNTTSTNNKPKKEKEPVLMGDVDVTQ